MTATTSVDSELKSAPDPAGPARPDAADFAEIHPELFAPTDVAETLHTVASLARRTFGCDAAGVFLTADGRTPAATAASGTDAIRAEGLQVQHHQGPGYDAIIEQQPVTSSELRFDSRWRFWAPQVAGLGFRSVRSFVLANRDPFGAVTLYSRHPSFFRTDSLAAERGFAQQASIAITVGVEREQLRRARDSRGIIGQAQGILMERYEITAEQAFAVLTRYSSHLNQKLRLVAERIVSERSLPGLGAMVHQAHQRAVPHGPDRP
jgi:uncharacterized protein YigA (DUF484 family)